VWAIRSQAAAAFRRRLTQKGQMLLVVLFASATEPLARLRIMKAAIRLPNSLFILVRRKKSRQKAQTLSRIGTIRFAVSGGTLFLGFHEVASG
jgi:hypothetical protein